MKALLIALVGGVLAGMLLLSPGPGAYAQATATFTPTNTVFKIPFINVPLLLPTGVAPFPTRIPITPGQGQIMQLNVNPVAMAYDALNISLALRDAMGAVGNVFSFLVIVYLSAGIGKYLGERFEKKQKK